MKFLRFFVFLLILSFDLKAQYSGVQTSEYIIFNQSVKSAGMGLDTIFPESSNLFWNSAALSFRNKKELFLSNGAIGEANTPFLALYFPMKIVSLGFSFWSYEIVIPVYDFSGYKQGNVDYGGNLFSFAGSIKLWKNFSFGLTINSLHDYLHGYSDEDYSSSFSNISFLWKIKKFNISLTQFNVGEARFSDIDEKIVSGGKLGMGYDGEKLRIGLEFGSYGDAAFAGIGGEYKISERFTGRMGFIGRADDSGFTFGFSYNLGKGFGLDFAFQGFDIVGKAAQIGVGYSWGEKGKIVSVKKEEKKVKKEEIKKVEIEGVKKGEKINIAVLDFDARPPLSPAEAGFISDFFRADFVKSQVFTVVDRNNMEKIFAEQGLQQTGCTTTECAVELGKVLNVKFIVTGSCGKLFNKYVITMNVIDVETAKIIYSDDKTIDNPDLLRNSITEMTSKFLDSIK